MEQGIIKIYAFENREKTNPISNTLLWGWIEELYGKTSPWQPK